MNGPGSVPASPEAPPKESRAGRLSVAALRRALPQRMWGGKGCGAPCDFCRVRVTLTDVEYEVEAILDDEVVTLHFHPRCHEAWRNGREPPVETSAADPGTDPAAESSNAA